MEGAQPYTLAWYQHFQALFHLVGGFVRKGQSEDLVRANSLLEEIGDPVGDNASFTTAWTGEDEQGALDMLDSLTLCIGEAIQDARFCGTSREFHVLMFAVFLKVFRACRPVW